MAPRMRPRCWRSVVLLEFGGHGVEQGAVAELGGGGEGGVHHVGVDAFARLQPLGGEAAGFVAERCVVALRGDEGDDAGALEGGIGVFAGFGGPAEAAGAGAERRLDEARVIGQQIGGEEAAGFANGALGQADDLTFGGFGEGGGRGENFALRDFAGVEQGGQIVEQGHALGGIEIIAGQEFGEQGGIVAGDVVAGAVGVGGEIGGARGGVGKAELGRGLVEQEAFLLVAFGGLVAYADRGLPDLTGVAGGAGGQVALLGERERGGRAAIEADGDQREAGLLEVGGEGAGQLGLSGGGDGVQEIADARVLVAVALEIRGDARLEFLLAHPAFEHADDAGALLVGDAVEGVGDIVLGHDGLADFARGHQAVLAHGAELAVEVAEARVPLGLPVGEDLGRGPGGEGLVEPGVVPPGEGHQIAEPLVGQLVGGYPGIGALALFGIDGGVGENQVLGVGDHAGVFHGAEAEGEGDGDVVALLEGEGNAEVSSPGDR